MKRHIRYIGESHFAPFAGENETHGWYGAKFGPIKASKRQPADKTVWPPHDDARTHRLVTDPTPTAPIDPWREAKQHFGRLLADVKSEA